MWSYIKSFFSNEPESEDLTLENACSLLSSSSIKPKEVLSEDIIETVGDNAFLSKTGKITDVLDKHFIIDNTFITDKSLVSFRIEKDLRVSFDVLISEGREKVTKVSLVDNEWDIAEDENKLWSSRIFICKVEERTGRKLLLSPGEIEIDLNNVSIEFLPIIGDWLELDVKCSVNENSVNLLGKIIEINKISPVRPHVTSGVISNWNNVSGLINKNIFYNQASLSSGYKPVVGDKVVVQAIESEQNRCCWRAIQVIPEYLKNKSDNPLILNNICDDFISDHPGIFFKGLNVFLESLNIKKQFCISIENNMEEDITLKKVEILNKGQCKILDLIQDVVIKRGHNYGINCESTARNIGETKDFILFTFGQFKIGKWINIIVQLKNIHNYSHQNRYEHDIKSTKDNRTSKNQIIRGQGINKVRFQAVKIPLYDVPQKLLSFFNQYDHNKDAAVIMEELRVIKPVLFSNLSYTNYEDKFHTLLHLDEIANLIAVRCYDQEKACFIVNHEFLMLEIENLSEKRPSIVLGDKILATDPFNERGRDYEGVVHKVSAKHVYLKFSPLFHDQYNGEDYSIKVIPGRQPYRKLHHAIYSTVRSLGGELLFPSKLTTKDPQVELNLDEESNDLKFDWYNEKLNLPQKNAVLNVFRGNARPLPYIIFGPPGTGKTVTIIEIILQIIRWMPQSRLLITAPSNSASDLIALRLIDSGVLKPGDLIRLISYNYATSDAIPPQLVPYCATGSIAKDGTGSNNEFTENGISFELSQSAIGRHRITVSTCTTAGQFFNMGLPKGHFSHILVDEAAQAAEPDVMIPISFLDKTVGQVILAGDPMQLGPVVLSRIAAQCGLNESYLERLINRFPYVRDPEGFPDSLGYDPKLVTKLVYNYRALPELLGLYSNLFYNDELIATIDNENSEEAKLVENLGEISPVMNSDKVSRIIFHGVNGENFQTEESPSWCNPHEAAQIFYYVNELYRLGLGCKNIGIITPYIKQVKEIRSLLAEAEFDLPKIGTVEEFQGQEFDVILISTVRSCDEYIPYDISHSLGFVACPKRLNVALSRAKCLLVIVGNPTLLSQDVHWRSVIKYCIEKGCYTGYESSF